MPVLSQEGVSVLEDHEAIRGKKARRSELIENGGQWELAKEALVHWPLEAPNLWLRALEKLVNEALHDAILEEVSASRQDCDGRKRLPAFSGHEDREGQRFAGGAPRHGAPLFLCGVSVRSGHGGYFPLGLERVSSWTTRKHLSATTVRPSP